LAKSGQLNMIDPGGPDRTSDRRMVNSPSPGMRSRACLRISPSPSRWAFPLITV